MTLQQNTVLNTLKYIISVLQKIISFKLSYQFKWFYLHDILIRDKTHWPNQVPDNPARWNWDCGSSETVKTSTVDFIRSHQMKSLEHFYRPSHLTCLSSHWLTNNKRQYLIADHALPRYSSARYLNTEIKSHNKKGKRSFSNCTLINPAKNGITSSIKSSNSYNILCPMGPEKNTLNTSGFTIICNLDTPVVSNL